MRWCASGCLYLKLVDLKALKLAYAGLMYALINSVIEYIAILSRVTDLVVLAAVGLKLLCIWLQNLVTLMVNYKPISTFLRTVQALHFNIAM